MKLIENFDTWSNNHFQKTSRASKPAGTLNESDDMFSKIMEGIKSSMAYAKATGMMKKWEELSKASNADIIALALYKKGESLRKQLEPLANQKANAKGDAAKKPIQDKIDKVKAAIRDITERGDELKIQAANEKEAFKEKLDDLKKDIKEPFANLYEKQLSAVNRSVLLDGAKAKGELANIQGNEKALAEAKKEEAERAAELDKIRKDLADGKDVSSEELEELDELRPFINDITKVQVEKQKVDKANDKIDGATASSVETAAGDDESAQKSALEDLKAKLNVKKTAQEGLWDAKKGLYDKVKGSGDGVTKTMISLAGGVADKAQKSGDKWKIADLNSSWGKEGDPATFIDKTEYTKSTQDEINKVDTKLDQLQQAPDPQTNSYTPNVSGSQYISESIATRFKRAMDLKGPRY